VEGSSAVTEIGGVPWWVLMSAGSRDPWGPEGVYGSYTVCSCSANYLLLCFFLKFGDVIKYYLFLISLETLLIFFSLIKSFFLFSYTNIMSRVMNSTDLLDLIQSFFFN
jgi:hypothetical protein